MLSKAGRWYSEVFLYQGSRGLSILARIGLFLAMTVNVYMVIVRKLIPALGFKLGTTMVGGYEITQVTMVFMVSCAFCYTWYAAGHIRVGLIRDMMKERPKAGWDAFYAFLGTFYLAIVVWALFVHAGQHLAMASYTPLMKLPIPPFVIILCVVMAHAILVFLRSFIGLASKAMGKKFARESYLEGQ